MIKTIVQKHYSQYLSWLSLSSECSINVHNCVCYIYSHMTESTVDVFIPTSPQTGGVRWLQLTDRKLAAPLWSSGATVVCAVVCWQKRCCACMTALTCRKLCSVCPLVLQVLQSCWLSCLGSRRGSLQSEDANSGWKTWLKYYMYSKSNPPSQWIIFLLTTGFIIMILLLKRRSWSRHGIVIIIYCI